jgi:transcriptional regulator with XRE-family HTH domain
MVNDPREGLIRGARELLRWDQATLSAMAGVHISTVRRFEMGVPVDPTTVDKLVAALDTAGILFLPPKQILGVATVGGIALKRGATPLARPEYQKAKETDPRLLGNGGGEKIRKKAASTGISKGSHKPPQG